MSRIGIQPISIPEKTEVVMENGGVITVKGPLGELSRVFKPDITIEIQDGKVVLSPAGKKGGSSISSKNSSTESSYPVKSSPEGRTAESASKDAQSSSGALWGTYASHLSNMIRGVNELYQKQLIIEGVGFKSELRGDDLVMSLGFSHPVTLKVPNGLTVVVEKNTITISGIDKELVGYFSARIRDQKKPEPYKGKGIRYSDEVIRRKQGKRAA